MLTRAEAEDALRDLVSRLDEQRCRASRGRQDIDDIRLLLRQTATHTVADAVGIYEHFYQEDEIKPRAVSILHELLDS